MKSKLVDLTKVAEKIAKTGDDRAAIAATIKALDDKYALSGKLAYTPGLDNIIIQLLGRIFIAFGGVSAVAGRRILDIACGSNTSRAPQSVFVNTIFGAQNLPSQNSSNRGYSPLFEPWFCRILLELGAQPVGVDFGDLEGETFEKYRIDLGISGALDIFPANSFDAIQDSRLFGSPEFTAQFPNQADRLKVAAEIRDQELRLLKPGGIIIHSDAADLFR